MPKKVTKEQIDRIVHLRDVERLPWERISEDQDVLLGAKTCKKYYEEEKEKAPRGEGELYAEAFRLFDRGAKPGDAVRELRVTTEKAKELYGEYVDMRKEERDGEEAEHPEEKEPSISEEFEVFKKRGNLTHTCQELLGKLDYRFEAPLTREKGSSKGTDQFPERESRGRGRPGGA